MATHYSTSVSPARNNTYAYLERVFKKLIHKISSGLSSTNNLSLDAEAAKAVRRMKQTIAQEEIRRDILKNFYGRNIL